MMTDTKQKWAFVEMGKPNPSSDWELLRVPSDFAGFFPDHKAVGYRDILKSVVAASQRYDDHTRRIYLGFDGERYFACVDGPRYGIDATGRPWGAISGYVSESGNFTDDIPLLRFRPEQRESSKKRGWLLGHEAVQEDKGEAVEEDTWVRSDTLKRTDYQEYPSEMGSYIREHLADKPAMRDALINAGKMKTPFAFCLNDGKILDSTIETLKELPEKVIRHHGRPRTPAPRDAEEAVAPEASRPDFLESILQPDSADQGAVNRVRALLDGKLKPDVDPDALTTDIIAACAVQKVPQK